MKLFEKIVAIVLVMGMMISPLTTFASEVIPTPTVAPTETPTVAPTETPGVTPTVIPTETPAVTPIVEPTATPKVQPATLRSVSEDSEAVTAGAVIGVAKLIGPATMNLLISTMETYFTEQEEINGNEFAGFLGDLIRNNTADEIHEIYEMVRSMNTTLNAMYDDMNAQFDAIMAELHREDMKKYMLEFENIKDDIKDVWDEYDSAIAAIEADKEGASATIVDLNDPVFDDFFDAIKDANIVEHLEYLENNLSDVAPEFSFYKTVENMYVDAVRLEHQYTDEMIQAYQLGTTMQITLLSLYGEGCGRESTGITRSQYDKWEKRVADSLDKQQEEILNLDERPHETIYMYNDPETEEVLFESSIEIEFSNGTGKYPAFEVVSNKDKQKYVIVNQAFKLDPFVDTYKYTVSQPMGSRIYYYDRMSPYYYKLLQSRDGKYVIPEKAEELDGLFGDREGTSFSEWLRTELYCSLPLSKEPNMYLVRNATDSNQCFISGDSQTDTSAFDSNQKYFMVKYRDISSNSGSYENYVDGKKYKGGDLTTWLVYRSVKGDERDQINVKTRNEFKKIHGVGDGQTLDLTDLDDASDSSADSSFPHVITVTGKATIKSKTSLTLEGVTINVGEGAEVTLENINIDNDKGVRNLVALGDATVIMEGKNSFSSVMDRLNTDDGVHEFGGSIVVANGHLTIKGSGTLDTKITDGGPAIQVPVGTGISIEELVLNVKASYMRDYTSAIGMGKYSFGNGCGQINITNGANVSVDCGWNSGDNKEKAMIIGITGGNTAPGKIENCTFNAINVGYIPEEINIADNVNWVGMNNYSGKIKTMDFQDAGTDSDMYVEFVGVDGRKSGKMQINDAVHETDALNRGATEKFDLFGKAVGKIDYIEVSTKGSNGWRGEYIEFASRIGDYSRQEKVALCEWINNDGITKRFYPEVPVMRVEFDTSGDTNAGTDATIYMSVNYVDENGQMKSTEKRDCKEYIDHNAYQSSTNDILYINYDQILNKKNAITEENFRGLTFRIKGSNGWKLASYKYSLITPWDNKKTMDGQLKTEQWINDEMVDYAFYIRPEESVQYHMVVETKGGKSSYGSDNYVFYSITDGSGNKSKRVWCSHNASGDTMKAGGKDEFNAVFNIATDDIAKLTLYVDGNNDWTPERIRIYRIWNGKPLSQVAVFKIDKKLNKDSGSVTFTRTALEAKPRTVGGLASTITPTAKPTAKPTAVPHKGGSSNNKGLSRTITGKSSSAKTGDNNNFMLWLAIMAVAGLGMTGVAINRRKKKVK